MNTYPNPVVVAKISERMEKRKRENAAKIRAAEKLLKAKRRNLTVRKQEQA